MKYSIAVFLLFISAKVISQQKQFKYFMDADLNPVKEPKAIYNGIGVIVNGLLEFKLYNAANNTLVLTEHFSDSSLQLNEGLLQSYFSNSSLEQEGNYVHGKQDGVWKRWDTLGRIIDSSIFSYGKKTMEIHTGYYKNGVTDSLIINDIKNDKLSKTYFNDKGQMVSEANFIGQNGIVKYYDSTMHATSDTVSSREEIEASFPGGEKAWTAYITKQLEKNIDALQKDGKSGTLRVRFIVDKQGNVKNAEAINMQGTKLSKIVINAILKGPKWQPANQYGRYVNAYREQPVTFRVE